MLTDGETQGINEARLARVWRPPGVNVIFVQFWSRDERCSTADCPSRSTGNRPHGHDLDRLAKATGAAVFDETELDDVTARVRSALKRGRP